MKTSDLTNGERIVILRRRSMQSQKAAAAQRDVSLYKYRRWEADEDDPPQVSLGRLEPHEACFIHRRRAGTSLKDLADELELSRWWVCKMEYGTAPVDRLVAYWSAKSRPWRGRAMLAAR